MTGWVKLPVKRPVAGASVQREPRQHRRGDRHPVVWQQRRGLIDGAQIAVAELQRAVRFHRGDSQRGRAGLRREVARSNEAQRRGKRRRIVAILQPLGLAPQRAAFERGAIAAHDGVLPASEPVPASCET